jgi:hypothetical protein
MLYAKFTTNIFLKTKPLNTKKALMIQSLFCWVIV